MYTTLDMQIWCCGSCVHITYAVRLWVRSPAWHQWVTLVPQAIAVSIAAIETPWHGTSHASKSSRRTLDPFWSEWVSGYLLMVLVDGFSWFLFPLETGSFCKKFWKHWLLASWDTTQDMMCPLFPTCQVRVVRFYVRLFSSSFSFSSFFSFFSFSSFSSFVVVLLSFVVLLN